MHENIQKSPKLLIVSDTAIRINKSGSIEAFEPVVREIENIQHLFDSITWIGYNYTTEVEKKNMRTPHIDNLKVIFLERTGGKNLASKINIILKMVPYFFIVLMNIIKSDVVHTRSPSLPAFLTILISFIYRKPIYWQKYAGSWNEKAPPFYSLQRFLLNKASNSKVTINGKWPSQSDHLLTFENPCLTDKEIKWIVDHSKKRDFSGKLNFCFIGNLNEAKGVDTLINVFSSIDSQHIGKVHFIGDGEKRKHYEAISKKLPFIFHGFLLRSEMHKILDDCHFLLLATKTEGFPKVIAEVAPYGIIPIVSAVSSIPQYINNEVNGFLIDIEDPLSLKTILNDIFMAKEGKLPYLSSNIRNIAKYFTYERFAIRITKDILNEK